MVVEVRDISFRKGGKIILDDISFEVERGTFLSVLGKNGAGKTSLLKCIALQSKDVSGEVFYNDNSLTSLSNQELAKYRSVLAQKEEVSFSFKVFDIVRFGRYMYEGTGDTHSYEQEVMKLLDIWPLADRDYYTLSGGEQQKVLLARAIVQLMPDVNNKVLLLDEPLSFLDLKYKRNIMTVLSDLCKKGLTIISVLHDLNIAYKYSDQVLLLKEGRSVFFGDRKEGMSEDRLSEVFDVSIKMNQLPNGGTYIE